MSSSVAVADRRVDLMGLLPQQFLSAIGSQIRLGAGGFGLIRVWLGIALRRGLLPRRRFRDGRGMRLRAGQRAHGTLVKEGAVVRYHNHCPPMTFGGHISAQQIKEA